jgi:putative addiction module CopG family antidote
MTINLSKELEQFVHNAVLAGRYATADELVNDALSRLRQAMPKDAAKLDQHSKHAKPAKPKKKPINIEELHQQMLASGLISQLPDSEADFDDPDDQPVSINGEPLSETIIRERR